MHDRLLIDVDDLLREIGRYLAAVEVFRSVDCEPSWRLESEPPTIGVDASSLEAERAQSIR
jgi:hypothetical protein